MNRTHPLDDPMPDISLSDEEACLLLAFVIQVRDVRQLQRLHPGSLATRNHEKNLDKMVKALMAKALMIQFPRWLK